jgi:hypothetical protein
MNMEPSMTSVSAILEELCLAFAKCKRDLSYEAERLYESGELDDEPQSLRDKIQALYSVDILLSKLVEALISEGVNGQELRNSLEMRSTKRLLVSDDNRRDAYFQLLNKVGILEL